MQVTTTENDVQVNAEATEDANGTAETTEAPAPEVKYPTYRELAFATWKLAYRLAYDESQFCSEGANEYLEYFQLPRLVHVDGNEELKDNYLTAWFRFNFWNAITDAGELDGADDLHNRTRLARTIRTYLERREPKSRVVMNGWLAELGLEPFAPPRHAGRYEISYIESTAVNSARVTEALRREFPELDVQVTYERRTL